MTVKDNKSEEADLARLNAQLTRSLEQCEQILADCRSKLRSEDRDISSTGPDKPAV